MALRGVLAALLWLTVWGVTERVTSAQPDAAIIASEIEHRFGGCDYSGHNDAEWRAVHRDTCANVGATHAVGRSVSHNLHGFSNPHAVRVIGNIVIRRARSISIPLLI